MRLSWRAFFGHKHSVGRILCLWPAQLTFDFDDQLIYSLFHKNPGARAITPVQERETLAE